MFNDYFDEKRKEFITSEQASVFNDLPTFKVYKKNKKPSDLMKWFNKVTPQERKMYKFDCGGSIAGYQIVRICTDDWFEGVVCDYSASSHYLPNQVMRLWEFYEDYYAKITGVFALFGDDPNTTKDIICFSLEVKNPDKTVTTVIQSYHRSLEPKDPNSIESLKHYFNIKPKGMINLSLFIGSNVRLKKIATSNGAPDVLMLPINDPYVAGEEIASY